MNLKDALWVVGDKTSNYYQNSKSEVLLLESMVSVLRFNTDGELAGIKKAIAQTGRHIVLLWMLPAELNLLKSVLLKRGNFSIVANDWWVQPPWAMRHADYILFRRYHGVLCYKGQAPFLGNTQVNAPLLTNPYPEGGWYAHACAALRLPALAASPVIDTVRALRRGRENPARLIFFPFSIAASDVPRLVEPDRYDVANTGGTCGLWAMRDVHSPFRHSFANLYHDRDVILNRMGKLINPVRFYDCRHAARLTWGEYTKKNQQTKFLMATSGMTGASTPKYLEYICAGTPIIGNQVIHEYPWQDKCVFTLDITAKDHDFKEQLADAMEAWPLMKSECLRIRQMLLKMYSMESVVNVAQDQIDYGEIPANYIRNQ